jgi:Asp-tRNA(Asn)/Glu-tRNA(Gln) amidotransferase A subunit family amidase
MNKNIDRRVFLTNFAMLAAGIAAPAAHANGPADRPDKRRQLTDLTAVAAVTAMRNGELKAEDYAHALLDRAQQLDGLNAFRTLDQEMVLEAARAADKSRASGAHVGTLHGLPIPVKDSVNSKALPTSYGTAAFRNFRPNNDAGVLKLLLAQGGILMGKTNIHELSAGWTSNNPIFGAVHNPYDPSRIPGGSSGGSAVAVAACMAPLAVAADTWGSIRVPASMCGLAGLRPSYGRYPDDGILPLADAKFDQSGSLARTVGDLALFDAALTSDRGPLTATPLKGVRVGIAPEFLLSGLDPEVERITTDAMQKLRAVGVELIEVELPDILKTTDDTVDTIMSYEGHLAVSAFLDAQGAGITFDQMLQQASEDIRRDFDPADRPTQDAYQAALAQRQRIREATGRFYEQHRIVALTFPPILIPPPPISHEGKFSIGGKQVSFGAAMTRNTALGTCADLTSLVLPAGMTSNGLPVGLEFDALTGHDRALLALGLSLEKGLGSIPSPRFGGAA